MRHVIARQVSRSLCASLGLRVVTPVPRTLRTTKLCTTFTRFASNSTSEESQVDEIVKKITNNPEIRELIDNFQALLAQKGFQPHKPPSMMEMMRLFADKEVRDLTGQLKVKFDEAGIKITPDQISQFMSLMKK